MAVSAELTVPLIAGIELMGKVLKESAASSEVIEAATSTEEACAEATKIVDSAKKLGMS